ncbi:MAG: class I SAM-dependent methyltransferase [Candidatus Omnitrophica bacterium]|nr:class I SAM-dependent methyltransferase [Candidatus Omnitrophota bacterium]
MKILKKVLAFLTLQLFFLINIAAISPDTISYNNSSFSGIYPVEPHGLTVVAPLLSGFCRGAESRPKAHLSPSLQKGLSGCGVNLSAQVVLNNDNFSLGFARFFNSLDKGDKNIPVRIFPEEKQKKSRLDAVDVLLFPLRFSADVYKLGLRVYFIVFPQRSFLALIKKRLHAQITVLDVGTGNGAFVEKLQKLFDENDVNAEITGIDSNPTRVAFGLSKGRNLSVCDIRDTGKRFDDRSMDLIFLNAPDTDVSILVPYCMGLLKADGMLIIRLHNDMHYKVHFGHEYRRQLLESLKADYNSVSLGYHLLDLPEGEYSGLQKPMIITHKKNPEQIGIAQPEERSAEKVSGKKLVSAIPASDMVLQLHADEFFKQLSHAEKIAYAKFRNKMELSRCDFKCIDSVEYKIEKAVDGFSMQIQARFVMLISKKVAAYFVENCLKNTKNQAPAILYYTYIDSAI